jgi:hypothetical protein
MVWAGVQVACGLRRRGGGGVVRRQRGGGPCRDAAADKQAASDNVGEEKEGEVLSTLATDLGSLVLPAETRCREASIMWRPAQLPLA